MGIYVSSRGQQVGPLSPQEVQQRLASGEFQPVDLAWTEGQKDWTPLSTLPGFAGAPPPIPQVPTSGGQTPHTAPTFHPRGFGPVAPPPKTSGLAITSLVFGILSMILLPIVGALPAIICGHIARSQVKHSEGSLGGSGLALAGLILGYFNFFVIFLGIALPVFSQVAIKGQETKTLVNAKQIATACRVYATDHGGQFPPHLEDLVPKYLPDAKIFWTPAVSLGSNGFNYYGGRDGDPSTKILLATKTADKARKRIVAYVDTSAKVLRERDLPDLPPSQ